MKEDEGHIEYRSKVNGSPQNGRKNNRCMPKEHRDDKPQKQGMQHCIVSRAGTDAAKVQSQQTADSQPGIAGKETHSNETRQACLSHGAPGNIVA